MRALWKADHHADGWAVYRTRRGQREVYSLPSDPAPVTFERQRAAAIWADILNTGARAAADNRRMAPRQPLQRAPGGQICPRGPTPGE